MHQTNPEPSKGPQEEGAATPVSIKQTWGGASEMVVFAQTHTAVMEGLGFEAASLGFPKALGWLTVSGYFH